MKQNDLQNFQCGIIQADTIVYQFVNNELAKAKVTKVEINIFQDEIKVRYYIHYLSGRWSDTSLSQDEMMIKCSLNQEDCVKQFLESIGVKAKISIEFE